MLLTGPSASLTYVTTLSSKTFLVQISGRISLNISDTSFSYMRVYNLPCCPSVQLLIDNMEPQTGEALTSGSIAISVPTLFKAGQLLQALGDGGANWPPSSLPVSLLSTSSVSSTSSSSSMVE